MFLGLCAKAWNESNIVYGGVMCLFWGLCCVVLLFVAVSVVLYCVRVARVP